jgi:acetyl-CoA acetyltransferase
MRSDAMVVDAVRSPIGKRNGTLAACAATTSLEPF